MSRFTTSLISLTVLLTLSACGSKNKELKSDAPAAPAPQTAPQSTTPNTTTGGDKSKSNDNSTNASDDAAQAQAKKHEQEQQGRGAPSVQVPGTIVGGGDSSSQTRPGRGQHNSDGGQSHQAGGGQVKQPKKPVETKVVERKLTDIDFGSQFADLSGGQTKDLFYTGAGRDGLLAAFKSQAGAASSDQQKLNANLSRAIIGARMSKANKQSATIDLAIDESFKGGIKNYQLKATPAFGVMNLSLVKQAANGNLEFQGGYLKCLDLDGGCDNSYAYIKLSGGYAKIIFRKSYVDTFFLMQEKITNNAGFDELKDYAQNKRDDVSTAKKIDKIQVASYEVVNGRAGMGFALTTVDKQMVGLSIPLLVSDTASLVDVAVAKSSDISRGYDLQSSAGYSSQLSQSITDARLVGNTGLGELKLKLNFAAGANSGSIWIIVSKVQVPTLSLEQVQAFEAAQKPF